MGNQWATRGQISRKKGAIALNHSPPDQLAPQPGANGLVPAIGVVVLIVGGLAIALSNVLVARAFEQGSSNGSMLAVRLVVPALLFSWPAVRAAKRTGAMKRDWRPLGALVALDLIMCFGEIVAISRIPVALAVLFLTFLPVWVALASWLLFGKPLRRRDKVALLLVVVAAAVVVGPPEGRPDLLGVAAALGTGMVGAGVFLFLEYRLRDTPSSLITSVGLGGAAIVALAASPGAFLSEFTGGSGHAMLVLSAGATYGVAWVLYVIGVARAGALVAGVATCLEPGFAALLGLAILGQIPTEGQVIGGALAITGLALIATGRRSPERGRTIPAMNQS